MYSNKIFWFFLVQISSLVYPVKVQQNMYKFLKFNHLHFLTSVLMNDEAKRK